MCSFILRFLIYSSAQPSKVDFNISILLRRKLRLREAKRFAQGHTASKDLILDLNPSFLAQYRAFSLISVLHKLQIFIFHFPSILLPELLLTYISLVDTLFLLKSI